LLKEGESLHSLGKGRERVAWREKSSKIDGIIRGLGLIEGGASPRGEKGRDQKNLEKKRKN